MRPCSLVVHIASSSLAHVWKANMTGRMLLYLRRETLAKVRVMWPNTHSGFLLTALFLINLLLEDRKHTLAQTTCTHARAHTHSRHPQNYSTCSYTHLVSYLLADTPTPTHTHAPITLSFSLSNKNTQHIHIQHAQNQSDSQAGSCYFDPDGEQWLFWWQLVCLTWGLWWSFIYRPTITLKNVYDSLDCISDFIRQIPSRVTLAFMRWIYTDAENVQRDQVSHGRGKCLLPTLFVAIIYASCFFVTRWWLPMMS